MDLPFPLVHDLEGVQRNFEAVRDQMPFVVSGAPAFQAKKGQYALRTDTPTVVNQRVYVNTADGANWTGIL